MKIPGMDYQCSAWKPISSEATKITAKSLHDLQRSSCLKPISTAHLEERKIEFVQRTQAHFCGETTDTSLEPECFVEDDAYEDETHLSTAPDSASGSTILESSSDGCPKASRYLSIINCHGENGYDLIARLLAGLPYCETPKGGSCFSRLGDMVSRTKGEWQDLAISTRKVYSEVRDILDVENFNDKSAGSWPFVREQLITLIDEFMGEPDLDARPTKLADWHAALKQKIDSPIGICMPVRTTCRENWQGFAYHDGRSVDALVDDLLEALCVEANSQPIQAFRKKLEKALNGRVAPPGKTELRQALNAALQIIDPEWVAPEAKAGAPRVGMTVNRLQVLRLVDTAINGMAGMFGAASQYPDEIRDILDKDLLEVDRESQTPAQKQATLVNAFLLFAANPGAPGGQCKAQWLLRWSERHAHKHGDCSSNEDDDEPVATGTSHGPLHTRKAHKRIEASNEENRAGQIQLVIDELRTYAMHCAAYRSSVSFDEVGDWMLQHLTTEESEDSHSPGNDGVEIMLSRLESYAPEVAYYLLFETLNFEEDQKEWILNLDLERKIERRFSGLSPQELKTLELRMFETGDQELASFRLFCERLGFRIKH